MSYDLLDRVYSIMIDVMTGVSAGSGNAVFYNTDSHTSFIEVSITNGTQSFNMSEYNYQLVISKPDKTGYNNSYTTTDNSKLVIALDSDMLSGIGNNIAQLYVMKTINAVSKVVTMIEFNYTVKAGNYSALAPESVNHDSMYIALRTDVDSILSKIENGELGGGSGSGLTATQAEQLATAYNHSQSPHITTADVNNAVSTYVTAHKEELKGDKGDKGDTGAKGEKGDTGATGANGITPTLKVGSTSTGNAGTNASVTMTDSNNVYTLNFVIPKGDKGDTGAKGDTGVKGQDGAKGADGITPTLKVGTVTTLAAGSNATVTMSENNNEYTLNFGIPKGNKGDTGASGSGGSSSGGGGIVFEDTYVSDANHWLTNGYTKTSGTATINLPSVCSAAKDKWGILFFIAENAANGTGTQMFFPIDGKYMGKIFTRSIANRTNISSWAMLASEDNIIEVVTGNRGAITLSNRMYQVVDAKGDIAITLPSLNNSGTYKEIHLFYWATDTHTITVASTNANDKLLWESIPTVEANAITEFIFKKKDGAWLCMGITYRQQS